MDRDYTIDDIREALRYLDESDRETWVRMGMAVKAEFGDAGMDAWMDWSAGYAKFKVSEARQVWRSFRRGGISLGTLIHEARQQGWQPRQITDQAERARLAAEADKRRAAAEAQARAEAERDAKLAEAAAELAERLWMRSSSTGKSEYLGRKRVKAHGIGFYNEPVIAEINTDTCQYKIIAGWDTCKAYLDDANQRGEDDPRSFKFLKRGTIAVPMRDGDGRLRNMQFIFKSGKKTFIRGGQKSGTYHMVGLHPSWRIGQPVGETICIAEGYATAASIHEATGLPVVVAWDCGNLLSVGEIFRARYPEAMILFCADNDTETVGNPGLTKATEAAAAVGGIVAVPDFQQQEAA